MKAAGPPQGARPPGGAARSDAPGEHTSAKGPGASAPPPQPARNTDTPPPIPSASILQGRDAISIEHNGRLYQLRRTRQGKLILTK